jgi:hypothetical protein
MLLAQLLSPKRNKMQQLFIVHAFRKWMKENYSFPQGYKEELNVFEEHGTQWIQDRESGAIWSVHETDRKFDFEQVCDGDFDAFYNEQASLQDS